ncbi:hypothetical protein JCM33374_g2298 [Metschnikowia sp. JCM 33374]|nr:hypothetical protein JCM33374_g2298 [Metschnikowia sp. JCM 33374]
MKVDHITSGISGMALNDKRAGPGAKKKTPPPFAPDVQPDQPLGKEPPGFTHSSTQKQNTNRDGEDIYDNPKGDQPGVPGSTSSSDEGKDGPGIFSCPLRLFAVPSTRAEVLSHEDSLLLKHLRSLHRSEQDPVLYFKWGLWTKKESDANLGIEDIVETEVQLATWNKQIASNSAFSCGEVAYLRLGLNPNRRCGKVAFQIKLSEAHDFFIKMTTQVLCEQISMPMAVHDLVQWVDCHLDDLDMDRKSTSKLNSLHFTEACDITRVKRVAGNTFNVDLWVQDGILWLAKKSKGREIFSTPNSRLSQSIGTLSDPPRFISNGD